LAFVLDVVVEHSVSCVEGAHGRDPAPGLGLTKGETVFDVQATIAEHCNLRLGLGDNRWAGSPNLGHQTKAQAKND
jgi:hypothetical protein